MIASRFRSLHDNFFLGREHHRHVASVELRRRLHLGVGSDDLGNPVQDSHTQLGVRDLASTEHDRDLDLVTLIQELLNFASFGIEVTTANFRAVFHLLDHDIGGLLAGLLVALLQFVEILRVVEDLAHRWVGHRRDFNKVELHLTGER